MPRIDSLICYPVKGCGGVALNEARMEPTGVRHDRAFMIVDEAGVFRSQRHLPRLAKIRPEITEAGDRLVLSAEGRGAVAIDVDTAGPRRRVDLFGTAYTGIDQGAGAATWLSAMLGAPSRLVRMPPEHERGTGGLTPGTSGYADSCAVLALSLASLHELNRRIAEHGRATVPMSRFRPNIVFDGGDPHIEDRIRLAAFGDAELGYAKPAIRCAVTTVDQATGAKAGPEPLATLARYRRAPEGGVAFGAKFAVVRPGKISVGDAVSVADWGAPEV